MPISCHRSSAAAVLNCIRRRGRPYATFGISHRTLEVSESRVRPPQLAASFISILGFVVVLIAVNPLFMPGLHITVAYLQSANGAVRV